MFTLALGSSVHAALTRQPVRDGAHESGRTRRRACLAARSDRVPLRPHSLRCSLRHLHLDAVRFSLSCTSPQIIFASH